MNFAGQFVVVSDYLYEPGAPLISDNELEEAVSALAVSGQAKELLRQLSVLAHFSHKESDGVDVVRQFSDSLAPIFEPGSTLCQSGISSSRPSL